MCVYIYIYMYIHVCIHVYIHIYIYMYREREICIGQEGVPEGRAGPEGRPSQP